MGRAICDLLFLLVPTLSSGTFGLYGRTRDSRCLKTSVGAVQAQRPNEHVPRGTFGLLGRTRGGRQV